MCVHVAQCFVLLARPSSQSRHAFAGDKAAHHCVAHSANAVRPAPPTPPRRDRPAELFVPVGPKQGGSGAHAHFAELLQEVELGLHPPPRFRRAQRQAPREIVVQHQVRDILAEPLWWRFRAAPGHAPLGEHRSGVALLCSAGPVWRGGKRRGGKANAVAFVANGYPRNAWPHVARTLPVSRPAAGPTKKSAGPLSIAFVGWNHRVLL